MLNILAKRWVSIMMETGDTYYNLKEKYTYLKENNIRCRTRNISEASSGGMGMNMMGKGKAVGCTSLDVYYKDLEKAQQLLKK